MARILILDGHSSAALAFVRSLGRGGHWVAIACTEGACTVAAKSRYCKACLCYPDPMKGVEQFIDCIHKIVQKLCIELVVPITDATVWPVSQAVELRRLTNVAAPSKEVVELVSDKYRTVTLAAGLGVPVPKTVLVRSPDELGAVKSWKYPIVIKDRFSINWKNDKGFSGGVRFAYNPDDLISKIKITLTKVNEVMLQDFCPGVGIGFSCLSSAGRMYLPFEWRRLREKDPRGSGSSARKSVELDTKIKQYSRTLILETNFQGIAMVEFKKNMGNDDVTLMEINGRPWGSIQLPIHAGIDYPRYLVEWFLNSTLPPESVPYRENITCRWLTADLIHLENLLEGPEPGWPEPYPNFWVNLFKIALPWYPGLRYDHLSFDDPLPGILDLKKWFNQRVRKISQ